VACARMAGVERLHPGPFCIKNLRDDHSKNKKTHNLGHTQPKTNQAHIQLIIKACAIELCIGIFDLRTVVRLGLTRTQNSPFLSASIGLSRKRRGYL